MGDLFGNVSAAIANHTNGTWFTHEEVEHFLGDPDVDHLLALVLGAVAILYGKKLPHILALVASLSFGLWVGLVVQDRQTYDEPLFGQVGIPEGVWPSIVAGVLSGVAAGILCKVAWKAALVLLTSGLMMMLALALCRLANVSPEQLFQLGASALSAYRVVGAIVLVVAMLGSAAAVKKFHKHMITFASAHLGTLLLLSGISHFAARMGSDAPFSLLDDLARIISEVRGGRCHIWDADEDAHHLEKCDCQEQCRIEICAWISSSWTVLGYRFLKKRIPEWIAKYRGKKASEEERAPLSEHVSIPVASTGSGRKRAGSEPSAAIIGNGAQGQATPEAETPREPGQS